MCCQIFFDFVQESSCPVFLQTFLGYDPNNDYVNIVDASIFRFEMLDASIVRNIELLTVPF